MRQWETFVKRKNISKLTKKEFWIKSDIKLTKCDEFLEEPIRLTISLNWRFSFHKSDNCYVAII